MPPRPSGQSLLENAYKLATPVDNAAYYDAFAATYDTDFVTQMGYKYPKVIADAYLRHATPDDTSIVDIGCGTGLVAMELALPNTSIDGMDISPEMLAVAGQKSLYRTLAMVDLTGPLTPDTYGAVLSSGTSTHGHLGPEPLPSLLARSGAWSIIGVNRHHFGTKNIAGSLDGMVAGRANHTGDADSSHDLFQARPRPFQRPRVDPALPENLRDRCVTDRGKTLKFG